MKILNKKPSSGFTIIEVTIVLAIAGLIMAIVFVAVPAFERSAHNTQRRSDATHLAGLVNDYASNNAGSLPTCMSSASGCTNGLDVGGEKWNIMDGTIAIIPSGTTPTYKSGTDNNSMIVDEGAACDPTSSTISASSDARSFAIGYQVQTSAGWANACVGQ